MSLALGLRLLNIDAASLWIDEIYSLMVATVHPAPAVLQPAVHTASVFYQRFLAWQPMDFAALIELLKINVHMPLYYLLLNPWLGLFGTNAAALRSFSAFFSTLMIIPLYMLGNVFGGRRVAFLAAFVAAVLPFQIYIGQEGRMYALTLFWACLSALAFWKTLYAEKPLRWGVLHAVATTLGLLSHYMFVFYLGFQMAYALMWLLQMPAKRFDPEGQGNEFCQERLDPKKTRTSRLTSRLKRLCFFGATVAALGVVTVLWLPVYQIQQRGINEEYHFAKGLVNGLRYLTALVWQPLVMVAGDNNLARVFYLPVTVLLMLFYALGQNRQWLLSANRQAPQASPACESKIKSAEQSDSQVETSQNEGEYSRCHSRRTPSKGVGGGSEQQQAFLQREGFLLCWLLVPMLVQIAYDLIKHTHTVVIDRYVLLISPAMILLLALAFNRLFEAGRQKLACGLLSAMLLLAVANVWSPSPFRDEHNKKNLRGKFAYMLQNTRPDDLVFVNGPPGAPNLAAYYLTQTRPEQPMIYWINTYRGQPVDLPEPVVFAPYQRVWLFRNRANNERGLQVAKEYLQTMFPVVLETEEKHDWFLYTRK